MTDVNTADGCILEDIVRAAVKRSGAEDWDLREEGFWFRVIPPEHAPRVQGWKLHVSATPLAAPITLARIAPLLLEHRCAFKFARTLDEVFELVSTRLLRGSDGKFVTVYPHDDEQLRVLVPLLDAVTCELPGPAVLSDRPLRPGSRVSYRYGAFQGVRVLTNDGIYEVRLADPAGQPVKDHRRAWFAPPAWAPRPFPGDPASAAARRRPDAVLLDGRFEVRAAIRHANKGGIYRALDRASGAIVIIKQARAHVGSQLCGLDARDTLRHEAAMLDLLAGDGLTPQVISVFEAKDSLFLAEELIAGQTLESWALDRLGRAPDLGIPLADARLAANLVIDLVARVHARGLVLRDLKPANLMMTADGGLRLIDTEYVAVPGTPSVMARTPGYCPPEHLDDPRRFGPAQAQTVDLYALGATLFFLVTGAHPYLPPDSPPCRSRGQRLGALITAMARDNQALRWLAPLIRGLTRDDPGDRFDLARARDLVSRRPSPAGAAVRQAKAAPARARTRVLRDGIGYLCEAADFAAPSGPWVSGSFGATTDRCCVQHGTAGVLAVLTQAAATQGVVGCGDVLATVDRAARRLGADIARLPRILPGLLFGSSGTAVALHGAAVVLGNDTLAGQAIDLALAVPVDWPNPDVCHGLAGAGLGQLLMWQATADPRFLARAQQCADRLVAGVQRGPDGVYWPIPAGFDSELAGLAQLGFGHGVAGVAAFLLAAGLETGVRGYLDLACEAGRMLSAAADVDAHGLVLWPASRGGESAAPSALRLHWCSGVSGIGTFLVRLWRATGDERAGTLARQAGATVLANRWQHSPVFCHGLAGSGEFLLDLHEADPGGGYLSGAEAIAEAMLARDIRHRGRLLLPDETQSAVVADYGTGLAGALGFLLRLRAGTPRLLLPACRAVSAAKAPARLTAAR